MVAVVPGWMRLDTGAAYCGVSKRTFASWLKAGLPAAKINGCRLVRRQAIDDFLGRFERDENAAIDKVVDGILAEL